MVLLDQDSNLIVNYIAAVLLQRLVASFVDVNHNGDVEKDPQAELEEKIHQMIKERHINDKMIESFKFVVAMSEIFDKMSFSWSPSVA